MMLMATLIAAFAIGAYEGRSGMRTRVVVATAAAIMGASNLAASWPWFTSDPSTWVQSYTTSLLLTGAASLVFHVLPFTIGYVIGSRFEVRHGGPRE